MKTRILYQDLISHIPKKECTILIGARQTGKSTLLKQLNKALTEAGEPVILLNLERKDILLELNQSPENIFRYFPEKEKKKNYLLLDEVQYLQDPTNFLKLLYDEHAQHLKVIATGSSAFFLIASIAPGSRRSPQSGAAAVSSYSERPSVNQRGTR